MFNWRIQHTNHNNENKNIKKYWRSTEEFVHKERMSAYVRFYRKHFWGFHATFWWFPIFATKAVQIVDMINKIYF